MKTNTIVAAIASLACAVCASPVLAQSSGHAGHDAHATHTVQPAAATTPAQRWATDAPLRAGMRSIRQAVQALDHYEHGHMDATQAHNTAQQIDTAVNQMIAQCKLKPDADAALHGLLVKFIAGAKAVRESQDAPMPKINAMREALVQYPQLFNDPGWAK
ncbi:MAG: DnrO protein [Xanthomonadaceae bacterium]|nr:DnrO protein [Xanthomonadaceae bacterium]